MRKKAESIIKYDTPALACHPGFPEGNLVRNVTAGVLVFSCLGGIKNYAIITRIDIGKRDEKILFHFIRTDDWNCHHCVGSRRQPKNAM